MDDMNNFLSYMLMKEDEKYGLRTFNCFFSLECQIKGCLDSDKLPFRKEV